MSLSIILPVFFIIASGWFLKRIKIVGDDWIHILDAFTYYVALPALIIISIWDVQLLNREFLTLMAFSALTFAVIAIICFAVLHPLRISKNSKAAIFLAATTGNTVYMGFPIIEAVLGKSFIPQAALTSLIYLIPPLVLAIFVVRYWYNKEHSVSGELAILAKNPLVISALAGVVLSVLSIPDGEVVSAVKKSLSMLGVTASPVALFILGSFLKGKFFKKELHLVSLAVALKMIAFPLVVWIVYKSFFDINSIEIPLFLSAMPVAVTTFVISEKFNLDKVLIGNAILISTVASFFVIPIINFLIK